MAVAVKSPQSNHKKAHINVGSARRGEKVRSNGPSIPEESAIPATGENPNIDVPDGVRINSNGTLVEVDLNDKVIRSRYRSGNWAHYRYGNDGQIAEFRYARLNWSTSNGFTWTAQDGEKDYKFEGSVSVSSDGTLTIHREVVTRTIKLTGSRMDTFADGRRVESFRIERSASASDLFAATKDKKAYWQKHPVTETAETTAALNHQLRHLWSDPVEKTVKSTSVWKSISGTKAYLRSVLATVAPEKPAEFPVSQIASRVKKVVDKITGSFRIPENLAFLSSALASPANPPDRQEPAANTHRQKQHTVPYFEGKFAASGPPIMAAAVPRLLGPGVVIHSSG